MITRETFLKTMEVLKELISSEKYYQQLVILDKNENGVDNEINEKRVKFMNEVLHTLKQLKIDNLKNQLAAYINKENSMLIFIKEYFTLIYKGICSEKYKILNDKILEGSTINELKEHDRIRTQFSTDFLSQIDEQESSKLEPFHLLLAFFSMESEILTESENTI